MTPFKTRIDIAPDTRARLVELLNTSLAETADLYLQTKQAHWNVRGPFFFARHELFDQLASKRLGMMDQLAERAGTLGGYAEGSLTWAAENTQLRPYNREAVTGGEHLQALIDAYGTYAEHTRSWLRAAAEVDPATEDLFTENLREVELDLWFLESHLQG